MNEFDSFKIQGSRGTLAEQVTSFLKELIVSGKIRDGEKMPNETELPELLKVSKTTVREAMMDLVRQGLLYRHVGRGTFVNFPLRNPEILWVCGHDAKNEDISPYYSGFLRQFSKECARYEWNVRAVWGGDDGTGRGELSALRDDPCAGGYAFISCPPSHPLLRMVVEKGRPYVHISPTPVSPRFVSTDLEQGIRLGLQRLRSLAPDIKAAILCNKDCEEPARRALTSLPEIQAEILAVKIPSTMSAATRDGYQLMKGLMASGREWRSLLIFDDLLALGASEAILKEGFERSRNVNIVVRSSGHLLIPFHNPISYLLSDIAEEAGSAAKILHEQMSGASFSATGHICEYALVDSETFAMKAS